MQDGPKAVWSIPFISLAFCLSLKQNFISYLSLKVFSRPDCIFEIHQLWQSGFSMVYSNSYCISLFEPEIINIGQSSHKIYSNNILNFQECTILNTSTKKPGNLLKASRIGPFKSPEELDHSTNEYLLLLIATVKYVLILSAIVDRSRKFNGWNKTTEILKLLAKFVLVLPFIRWWLAICDITLNGDYTTIIIYIIAEV